MGSLVSVLLIVAIASLIFWPGWGLIARWRAARELAQRTRREDALKHILKEEVNGRASSLASVAGALRISENEAAALLTDLQQGGLVTFAGGAPRLLPVGRELAQHVIRAHRLWESFLADQTGVDEVDWHRQAERHEHLLSPEETDRLAAKLGHPLRDPHGDSIPAGGEAVAADAGQPLTELREGDRFTVVHLEDEPEALYRQIVGLGLRPGGTGEVEARSRDSIDVRASDGRLIRLNNLQATNVAVSPSGEDREAVRATLGDLAPGQVATVVGLSAACRGASRRRLLDLGFVPGTEVSIELVSPIGDPTAYRVRGSVVALRRSQARLIHVREIREAAA